MRRKVMFFKNMYDVKVKKVEWKYVTVSFDFYGDNPCFFLKHFRCSKKYYEFLLRNSRDEDYSYLYYVTICGSEYVFGDWDENR